MSDEEQTREEKRAALTDDPERGLTDEQLIQIGRVAVSAGGLDMVLTGMAGALTPDASTAYVLVSGDPVDTKVTKLTNLAAEKLAGSSLQERVLGWLSKVRTVHQRRDFLLHSAWVMGTDDDSRDTILTTASEGTLPVRKKSASRRSNEMQTLSGRRVSPVTRGCR